MGQTGRNSSINTLPPNRSAHRDRSVRYTKKRARRNAYALVAFLLFFVLAAVFAYKPASAATKTLLESFRVAQEQAHTAAEPSVESIVIQPASDPALQNTTSEFAIADVEAFAISAWQGAKNNGESFSITLDGIPSGQSVAFSSSNCVVSPQNGTSDDTYTVTVTGAGSYSITAVTNDGTQAVRETRTGVAGRADQMPLNVSGWGSADNYYDRFFIRVSGGSSGGAITFQTDGCSVSPAVGTRDTVFEVTVTRVGSYELTALMDGDTSYNIVYSACMSGCASKSNQSPVHIDDWVENANAGESFTVRVYGGSTSEALTLDALGCTVEKLSAEEYTVTVDSVGPYALTATRPGNYGYHTVSASVSGVSEKTSAPFLSVSGWSEARTCNDSFPITITGGVSGASITFVANGCTVSPASGTIDTRFLVTVTAAGDYSLSAVMAGAETYEAAFSRTYRGVSEKGVQAALRVENWVSAAPAGSSFEITVAGGCGSGSTNVTTSGGCTARLKSGESNVYVITVLSQTNAAYAVTVGKAGDASYLAAGESTVSGTTSGIAQTAMLLSGWDENALPGESFDVQLTGGSGTGEVTMELSGCKVSQSSAASTTGAYTVTVTALEGEPYSIRISHAGDTNYVDASIEHSGKARYYETSSADELIGPIATNTFSWIYICGAILLGFGLVLLLAQISANRRRHHYRRS